MSIRIEIEGASIEEVADKLLALGSKLAGVSAVAIAAAQPVEVAGEPEKPKRTRKTAPTADVVSADAAEASHPVTESQAGEAASPAAGVGEPTAAAQPAEASASDAAPLDFDKDVTPAVLGAVEKHGREKVSEILTRFGVARASQLDEGRWPELMDAIADLD